MSNYTITNAATKVINAAGGIVVDGSAVEGGYFVVTSTSVTIDGNNGTIPEHACVNGAVCYCSTDKKFYQYYSDSSAWLPVVEVQTTRDAQTGVVNAVSISTSANIYVENDQKLLTENKAIGRKTAANGEIFNDITNNTATAAFSHAEGDATQASGRGAHSEGRRTVAFGEASHAEGISTTKFSDLPSSMTKQEMLNLRIPDECPECGSSDLYMNRDTVECNSCGQAYINPALFSIAYGKASHVEGKDTIAGGDYSHAEGSGTIASGGYSHAEGYYTTASGDDSHAEGFGTTASGDDSHAEGEWTAATGDYSHAEGFGTTASGYDSHAEGSGTIASGGDSHAEGFATTASGGCSHAEGCDTTASGGYSHAEGEWTAATGYHTHAEGYYTTAHGNDSHAEGFGTTASGDYSHAEGCNTTASGGCSHAEGCDTTASGDYSHAEGAGTTASGYDSHAEGAGTTASGDDSHAEGYYTTASGNDSHAEGQHSIASGYDSHAEGYYTTAYGDYSHAEGCYTTASGYESHAEGFSTTASGDDSHAEGKQTVAAHIASHASGFHTNTSGDYQTVVGAYNTGAPDALFVVGNGYEFYDEESNWQEIYSNAFTVNKDGTATVGADPVKAMDVATKHLVDDKADYRGYKFSAQSGASYAKLCTINLPVATIDMHVEFDMIGRGGNKFQSVRCAVFRNNTTDNHVSVYVSGEYGNVYEVNAYKYINATTGGYVEIWCKIPSWDVLNVLKKNYAESGYATPYLTWNFEKVTALPTESATVVKVAAVLENWAGKAARADKLTTARTINLSGGATGTATSFDGSKNIEIPVQTIKEAYLTWGGKNFAASWGPIDAAMVPELGANRLAFFPATGVTIEYSTDKGATWSNLNNNTVKTDLFGTGWSALNIGNNTAVNIDKSSYMARITLDTTGRVYTALNKFAIRVATAGSTGCYCKIEAKTQANRAANKDTWTTFADNAVISGWSGYNIINVPTLITYGGQDQSQHSQIRLTFGVASHPATSAYPGLQILHIMAFGGEGWLTPSNLAKNGHLYTWDRSQTAAFPANITGTQITGTSLVGNSYVQTPKIKHTDSVVVEVGDTSLTVDAEAVKVGGDLVASDILIDVDGVIGQDLEDPTSGEWVMNTVRFAGDDGLRLEHSNNTQCHAASLSLGNTATLHADSMDGAANVIVDSKDENGSSVTINAADTGSQSTTIRIDPYQAKILVTNGSTSASEGFVVGAGGVSFNNSPLLTRDDSEFDSTITTIEEFRNLANYSGRILIKDLEFPAQEDLELTVSDTTTHLEFVNCSHATSGGSELDLTLIGNDRCSIRGLDLPYSVPTTGSEHAGCTLVLKNFRGIQNCGARAYMSNLTIQNSTYIDNCCARTITDSDYISNVRLFGDGPLTSVGLSNCDHITNMVAAEVEYVTITSCQFLSNIIINSVIFSGVPDGTRVRFENCSHLRNIKIASDSVQYTAYQNCTYVDPLTCVGVVSSEDFGKPFVMPNGEAYEVLNIKKGSGENSIQLMNSTATGFYTYAEGNGSHAAGDFGAHAEGNATNALGESSHSEGSWTTAQGNYSHAEGCSTLAGHAASHAGGCGTRTSRDHQTVIGQYNVDNTEALFIVGNGASETEENRKNAFVVNYNGTASVAADPVAANDVATKNYIDSKVGDLDSTFFSSLY